MVYSQIVCHPSSISDPTAHPSKGASSCPTTVPPIHWPSYLDGWVQESTPSDHPTDFFAVLNWLAGSFASSSRSYLSFSWRLTWSGLRQLSREAPAWHAWASWNILEDHLTVWGFRHRYLVVACLSIDWQRLSVDMHSNLSVRAFYRATGRDLAHSRPASNFWIISCGQIIWHLVCLRSVFWSLISSQGHNP